MKRILLFAFTSFLFLSKSYGAINFYELFPNFSGGNYFQSLENGWASFINNHKEIQTHEGCRKIYSPLSQSIFIPTKTHEEWNAFKNNKPDGVTINSCITHGTCGSSHNQVSANNPVHLCDSGNPSSINKDGTSFNWQCQGENGGRTVSCQSREPITCDNLSETTLLSFNGNIDHVLTIKVKVATESGKSILNIGGKSKDLYNKITEIGGYYQELNEGGHGDLWGNIAYTPLQKDELEALQTFGEEVIFKKISGSVPHVSVKEQPSKENGWVATIDFYTPAGDEQWINGKLVIGKHLCANSHSDYFYTDIYVNNRIVGREERPNLTLHSITTGVDNHHGYLRQAPKQVMSFKIPQQIDPHNIKEIRVKKVLKINQAPTAFDRWGNLQFHGVPYSHDTPIKNMSHIFHEVTLPKIVSFKKENNFIGEKQNSYYKPQYRYLNKQGPITRNAYIDYNQKTINIDYFEIYDDPSIKNINHSTWNGDWTAWYNQTALITEIHLITK